MPHAQVRLIVLVNLGFSWLTVVLKYRPNLLAQKWRRAISLVDVDIIPCVFFFFNLQRGKNRCSKTGVQRLLQITFSKPLILSNEILELIFVPLPSKEKNLPQDWLISDDKGYLRAYRRNTQTGEKVDFFFSLITGKKKLVTTGNQMELLAWEVSLNDLFFQVLP